MGIDLQFYIFLSLSVKLINGECDSNNGPAGAHECVLLTPYYSKYQWATCLTDDYIQTYTKGNFQCMGRDNTYCWYQCMVEIHSIATGPVYDDCACGSDTPLDGTTPPTVVTSSFSNWCFSPSGTECGWYRQCLEKRFPCIESDQTYSISYAEEICKLYQMHFSEFDNIGQQWIDGVRRCLQVQLVPVLRPFVHKTCEEIEQIAFGSYSGCYLNPGKAKPSICDIGCQNWAQVFWTIKSAVKYAPIQTTKQMIKVAHGCDLDTTDILRCGIEQILLTLQLGHAFERLFTDHLKVVLDNLSENVLKTLSDQMDWVNRGILNFAYPLQETHIVEKNSADKSYLVYINILLAERTRYDLNSANKSAANISATAIDLARAIELGDIQLNLDQVQITELSICSNYDCTKSSLHVKAAPPTIHNEKGRASVTPVASRTDKDLKTNLHSHQTHFNEVNKNGGVSATTLTNTFHKDFSKTTLHTNLGAPNKTNEAIAVCVDILCYVLIVLIHIVLTNRY